MSAAAALHELLILISYLKKEKGRKRKVWP
jgi:hypothetical protein